MMFDVQEDERWRRRKRRPLIEREFEEERGRWK